MLLIKIIAIGLLVAIVALAPLKNPYVFAMPHDLEQKLYETGVIDRNKIDGQLSELNVLWAFGLANKNEILEIGPMMAAEYGGDPSRFASTGGWTLAAGTAMDHYSMHRFVTLTPEQQGRVERTSKNIYRPCCKNPAYFPDCNHGMAMLGALEIMASQGASEKEMYRIAKELNRQWFPPETTGCSI